MANEEAAVLTSDMGKPDLEVDKPSPSQSLLQRLKNLREWQEKQQKHLLEGYSNTSPGSSLIHTPPTLPSPTHTSLVPSSPTHTSAAPPSFTHTSATPPSVTHASAAPTSLTHASAAPTSLTHASAALTSLTHASAATTSLTHASAAPVSQTHTSQIPPSITHTSATPSLTCIPPVSPSLTCPEQITYTNKLSEPQMIEDSTYPHSIMLQGLEDTVDPPWRGIIAPTIPTSHPPVKSPERLQDIQRSREPRQHFYPHEEEDLGEENHVYPETQLAKSLSERSKVDICSDLPPVITQASVPCGSSDSLQNDSQEPGGWSIKDPAVHAGSYVSSISCTQENIHCTEKTTITSLPQRVTAGSSITPSPQKDISSLTSDSEDEELLRDENREPYRSEKYKSSAIPNTGYLRMITEPSHAREGVVPSKSFFTQVSQRQEGSVDEKTQEVPKPRHRFLKKGHGTARFRMKRMRLKKPRQKVEEDKESGSLHHETDSYVSSPTESQFKLPGSTKSQFRLPMQTLHLEKMPQHAIPLPLDKISTVEPPQEVTNFNPPSGVGSVRPTTDFPNPKVTARLIEKEDAELSAFEKLEELAEDSSFSSNSSTIWQLLRQGQQSVSSTPLRTPPPFAPLETPVVAPSSEKGKNFRSESNTIMLNRIPEAPEHAFPQQQQILDVRQVLEQLRSIVRLEGHSISEITESDIQSFLEKYSNSPATLQVANPHPANILTSPEANPRPHHVHFASEGVRVVEYQLSDTEGEDTLTDAVSLAEDDSDLVTTSELEALTHLKVEKATAGPWMHKQNHPSKESDSGNSFLNCEATHTQQKEVAQGLQPVMLQFSPPPPCPPDSASNYIWSIFGKERDSKKRPIPKVMVMKPPRQPPKTKEREKENAASVPNVPEHSNEEVEIYKTLLLAKVAELEKETKLFKKENSKLQMLQQQTQEEKHNLEKEKHRLQEEAASERRRFQEYVDRERNRIWKEKQQVALKAAPTTQPQEASVEVVHLKEQIHDLREEAQRKESLNQFSIRKLNEKIRALEDENKKLKEKNSSLQGLEKENLDLRLRLERARPGGKPRPATQHTKTATQPTRPARGKFKSSTGRPTTVDGVTRVLEKWTRPQPIIIKEAQTNPVQAVAKHSDTKQDTANNNSVATEINQNVAGAQNRDANAKPTQPSPPHKEAPVMEDKPPTPPVLPPKRTEDPLLSWLTLASSEEAGREYTERVREDGTRELIYSNGNRKEIHPNGTVMVSFYNGDKKEIHADRTVYVYGADHTSHTTYTDGREEFIFPSGQTETRHPDGSSEISFTDGSHQVVSSDGTEICTTRDGTVVRTNADGSKVFEFPSGQREVHRGEEKRREYPNGTVKILHPDGRTETQYSSGRTRIKDQEGNVILDTDHLKLHPNLSFPS